MADIKTWFPLCQRVITSRCFRLVWLLLSGVMSKITAINSGKLIVHNLVMNITLIFPWPEESEAAFQTACRYIPLSVKNHNGFIIFVCQQIEWRYIFSTNAGQPLKNTCEMTGTDFSADGLMRRDVTGGNNQGNAVASLHMTIMMNRISTVADRQTMVRKAKAWQNDGNAGEGYHQAARESYPVYWCWRGNRQSSWGNCSW